MTLLQFDHLHYVEQEESICDQGVFLANRYEGELMYDLYQIDSFYVEFFYNINKNNLRVKLRCFSDTEELKPYLDSIDITKLF